MLCFCTLCCFFFSFLFNATPTTDIYTLSLHDALPISFFFGKGQCASCHMISGAGAAIGPDLSNVGREMTVDEIQAKLVNPNSRIAPGYELANAQLRNGSTIRGFVRNRSNFDIRLQDLTGQLHLIQQGEISAITEEKQSIMPPVKASPEELQHLIAYLCKRTGVGVGSPKSQPSKVAGIDFARISNPRSEERRVGKECR